MAISLLHLRIRGGAPPESRIPGPPLIGLSAISNLGAHQARRKGLKNSYYQQYPPMELSSDRAETQGS